MQNCSYYALLNLLHPPNYTVTNFLHSNINYRNRKGHVGNKQTLSLKDLMNLLNRYCAHLEFASCLFELLWM